MRQNNKTGITIKQSEDYDEYQRQYYLTAVKPRREQQRLKKKERALHQKGMTTGSPNSTGGMKK